MANIDPTACREYLYKDFIQYSLKDGNIPVAFIAKCIEDGVIDCHDDELILAFERSLGIRINPKVPPTIKAGFTGGAVGSGKTAPNVGGFSGMRRKQSPVMSSAIPPCLKEIPQREMFRQTVEEMDKRIKGSHSHAMEFKDFPKTILYDARNTWATPELFRTLASTPNFEVDRLRAAMYPATMSYCERMFEENGRTYMVPYVTVMEDFNQYGETRFVKGEDYYKGGSYDEGKADATYEGRMAVSTTFYLDRNGNISSMNGNYIHLFSVKDFESPKAVSAYMQEINRAWTNEIKGWGSSASRKSEKEKLKKLLDFLKPYASGKKPIDNPEELLWQFRKLHKSMFGCDTENNFINIKTGEKTFASIRHNIKESRKKDSGGNGWYRVLDVTDAIGPDGKLDRDLLVKAIYKGDSGKHHRDEEGYLNGLKKLYEKMIDEKNLVYRGGRYFDSKGEKEYLERDYKL